VAHEMLLTVDGAHAAPVAPISLQEAKLLETTHLQQWVVTHPEALAEGAKVVSVEFDKWTTKAGTSVADRLDVLAIDREGRLIVAELKWDKAPGTVTMQAINCAAMASRMSLDDLANVYANYLGGETTPGQALDMLREWAPEISDETLSPPRIVLVASEFGPTVTYTALFLVEQGLDLRLVRYQLYRLPNEKLVLSVSQLLPVPEAEEFMVRPRSSAATKTLTAQARTQKASIPQRLVEGKVIQGGEELKIVVPSGVGQDHEAIRAWLSEKPGRDTVSWCSDAKAPVRWAADGKQYNLTTLIRYIIQEATGEPPLTGVWGPNWYRRDGAVLHQLAEQAKAQTASEDKA